MGKDFTSIEELDSFFEEKKEDVKEEVKEEDNTPEEAEDDIPEELFEEEKEDSEEVDESLEGDDAPEEETPPKKPTKEEKRDYTFGKLRKEAAEAKKAFEEQNALIQRLMREAGYDDYNQFKEALDSQLSEKEMKAKGYTKEQYNEVENLRQRTKELEAQLDMTAKREMATKASAFNEVVKSYATMYKVTSKEVYELLDDSGFTVEQLLSLPKPEVLIRGVLADKAKPAEKPAKKAVDTEKLPSGGKPKGEFSIEDLLKAELDEYKVRKGHA